MKRHRFQPKCVALGVVLVISVLAAGCATTPASRAGSDGQLSNVVGKWSWQQGIPGMSPEYPWSGEFVLEQDGDSYTGTLDDISEGTFGDTIEDVTLGDGQLKFTRYGHHGVQHWQGTLTEEEGKLKIVDGQWTKGDLTGVLQAEKIE